jgi:hypothetical protein
MAQKPEWTTTEYPKHTESRRHQDPKAWLFVNSVFSVVLSHLIKR